MLNISDNIIALHGEGLTQRQMAVRLGCGLNTVRRRMKLLNLKPQSNGSRDYEINSSAFDLIDTEEKAYWFGFLLADGCLGRLKSKWRTLRVCLQARDESQLVALAKFLGYKGALFEDFRCKHHRKLLTFCDTQFAAILIKKGWLNYKRGLSFEILDCVPDIVFAHFVRGYFDGDGCFSYMRVKGATKIRRRNRYANISCKHKGALEEILRRVVLLGGPESRIRKRSKAHDIRWSNSRSRVFANWIYTDSHVFLPRKKNRIEEMFGTSPLYWKNITNFVYALKTDDLNGRRDVEQLIDEFYQRMMADNWCAPTYSSEALEADLGNCRRLNLDQYFVDGMIVNKHPHGNKIALHFQPPIWLVRQNKRPSVSEFIKYDQISTKAVRALFLLPKKRITPERLLREMQFVGFTKGSLLSTPVILAAMRHFGLSGCWFDPCAGWGTRLLAAHLSDCRYIACEPGIPYQGLLCLREHLDSNAELILSKWQDAKWPTPDFILTSPPFFNKEDYLDGYDYGTFEQWYTAWLKPLVEKSLATTSSVVMHVDTRMCTRLEGDYTLDKIGLVSISRHKAPAEWFVRIVQMKWDE